MTFSKVARRLGISKERVRQLRNRALSHLRHRLSDFDPNIIPEQACA